MFDKYPYTDFHEMNLDWIIAEMKQLIDDWEGFSGKVSASAHAASVPEVTVSGDLKEGLDFDFGLVQGPRGQTGARGETGPQGPQGEGLQILDTYPTLADLQSAHPTGSAGDAYLVGSGGSYTLYIWSTSGNTWTEGGSLTSPAPGNVNPSMDGTAAPGTSARYAREDHVHPSDTSKLNKSSNDGVYAVESGTQSMIGYSDNSLPDALVQYDSVGDVNTRNLNASGNINGTGVNATGNIVASGNVSADTLTVADNAILNSAMLATEVSSNAYRPLTNVNGIDPLVLRYDTADLTPQISFIGTVIDQSGTRTPVNADAKFTSRFIVNSTDYAESRLDLAPASASDLGGVKVGSGLSVTQDGTISVNASMQRDLLWSNNDSTQSFASQTVSLDLSSYPLIMIMYRVSTSSSANMCIAMPPTGYDQVALGMLPQGTTLNKRLCTPRSDGVAFYDARSDSTVDNTVMVPRFIYGIK